MIICAFILTASSAQASEMRQILMISGETADGLARLGFEVKALTQNWVVMQRDRHIAFCDISATDRVTLGNCHTGFASDADKQRFIKDLMGSAK